MKNLILIRHGKSSWKEPLEDKERPLSKRGLKDAELVSSKIAKYLPETFTFYSSTAKRAAETAKIFSKNISYPAENIIFSDELYTFDVNELEKVIKSFNNDFDCVILVGHNAAITDFVNKFGDIFIDNVPTSGFVSIDFDGERWGTIKKGKTTKTIFPKNLK